jgi:hypothetical protein
MKPALVTLKPGIYSREKLPLEQMAELLKNNNSERIIKEIKIQITRPQEGRACI